MKVIPAMKAGTKLLIGILCLSVGAYAYYVLLCVGGVKVARCVFIGTLLIVLGLINIINWKKEGVFWKFDKAVDDTVFGMLKRKFRPSAETPRPEAPAPPETKAEMRDRIKAERADLWEKPAEVEVIPPEPQLLRPPISSRETLDVKDINDLLGRR